MSLKDKYIKTSIGLSWIMRAGFLYSPSERSCIIQTGGWILFFIVPCGADKGIASMEERGGKFKLLLRLICPMRMSKQLRKGMQHERK